MIFSSSPLNVGSLLITVFASVREVFLLCLAGYVFAWNGILDKKTHKQMNRINVVTATRIISAVPIVARIMGHPDLSWFLGATFRLSRSQSTFGMILRWNYGVRLLAQADDPLDSPIRLPKDGDMSHFHDPEAMLPSASTATMVDSPEQGRQSKTPRIILDNFFTRESSPSPSPPPPPVSLYDNDATLRARPDSSKSHLHRLSYFYRSFPNSPNQSRLLLQDLDDTRVAEERPLMEEDGAREAEVFTRQPDDDFMTVPLYAAFLSIIVALIPSVQHTLEEKEESGDEMNVIPTRMEGVQEAGDVSTEGDGVDNRCKPLGHS
ncbi:hypothetical protein EV360DRAFT_73780 [Lentinula raphanica]|nr:hypothetical protein EV360DRAFT_73780 [Lentinula raphanica]